VESKEAQKGLFVGKFRRGWWGRMCKDGVQLGYLQGVGRSAGTGKKPSINVEPAAKEKKVEADEVVVPGLWVCGSYSYPGIPLLEACVSSAKEIAENGLMPSEGVYQKSSWAQT
jgi:hypothetical protein